MEDRHEQQSAEREPLETAELVAPVSPNRLPSLKLDGLTFADPKGSRIGLAIAGWGSSCRCSAPTLLRSAACSPGCKESLSLDCCSGSSRRLLGEPCRASLLLGFTCRLVSSRFGSLSGRQLCRFAVFRSRRAASRSANLAFRGSDDLRPGLQLLEPFRVFRNCPGTFELSSLGGAGRTQAIGKIRRLHRGPCGRTQDFVSSAKVQASRVR